MKFQLNNVIFSYLNVLLLWVLLCIRPLRSESVQMKNDNFDTLVGQHELVLVNFYADWCKFSKILAPLYEEAADKLNAEFPQAGKVLLGKVDCDEESHLSVRFRIMKYPTLKLFRHGKMVKKEYRGQRSAEAIITYIRDMLQDPVVEIKGASPPEVVESSKRGVVAYLTDKDGVAYDTFRKVAMDLRDECKFYANVVEKDSLSSEQVIFKPIKEKLGENDLAYPGDIQSYDELQKWATQQCIPLVREITFENAEELTEEKLPFLILFHHSDDKDSIELFNQEIKNDLYSERKNINFVTADGVKFSHPLHHLGKTQRDLPIIAIDSFRHMYLLPDFNDIRVPGKLKQFVLDLHSGKLHREFHYGPEPVIQTEVVSTDLPESTFKKLAPSKNRYTLLRDEL